MRWWWHWFWCRVYPRGVIRDGILICPVCQRVLDGMPLKDG